jgi:hypothetical protein
VHDFAFPEMDQALIRSASHTHAAGATPYANKLNHIMQAGVGHCSAKALGFQLRLSPY